MAAGNASRVAPMGIVMAVNVSRRAARHVIRQIMLAALAIPRFAYPMAVVVSVVAVTAIVMVSNASTKSVLPVTRPITPVVV